MNIGRTAKKIICLGMTAILMSGIISSVDAGNDAYAASNNVNVIMVIPDGESVSEVTLARWYNGGKLNIDEMTCGLVRTYSAESAITDSAAAATAYACGIKTNEGYEGIYPSVVNMPGVSDTGVHTAQQPAANIIEAARLAGKKTGIVVTAPVMHATPASFSAHNEDREEYDTISMQQVYQGIDVVMGGGLYYMKDGRRDRQDLTLDIQNRGYDYVTTKEQMNNSQSDKLFGVFAYDDMDYDFDMADHPEEPSLAEMTRKAIDVLDKNENGFFLLVEGSKIDYASHAHDPVGVVSEILSYDEAVKTALDFAKKDGNTVVISAADHGNGNMSIGVGQSGYASTSIYEYLTPLKAASRTGAGVLQKLNADRSNANYVVSSYYGISDLTEEEIEKIRSTDQVMATVGRMMSKRANIGWMEASGHTGEDVTLNVYAPEGMERLTGVVDNTDVNKYMERLMGLDLAQTSEKLFCPARAVFEAKGASISWDGSDEQNPNIVVRKGDQTVTLPINKSVAYVGNDCIQLSGLVILSGGNTYVPSDAVELIN